MKLDVPYYQSQTDTDCGPLAVKMVLDFFGTSKTFVEISHAQRRIATGLSWTAGLARSCAIFGHKVKMISIANFDPKHDDISYYKENVDREALDVLMDMLAELPELGVIIEEKDMSLDELLSYVTLDSVPIVLVNWRVISGAEGFSGHFMPLVGFDHMNVYLHNPGLADAQAFLPVPREVFVRAWEDKGTDKDVVVVFRQ